MRYDMAKVLIEDARTCSSERSRKWGQRLKYDPDSDYEDQPQRTGRRRRQGYSNKESTDVLGPLKGYLKSKVGQPWDDVYSEICAQLDRRSVTGNHVFTHLWQYVERNCYIGAKTGTVYTIGRYSNRVGWFYVHPWTGILCDSDNDGWLTGRFKPKPKPVTLVQIGDIGDCKAYEWIQGHWYYTEYSYMTMYEMRPYFQGSPRMYRQQRVDKVYQFKRQLGKKELKALGLSNKRLKLAYERKA